RLVDGESGEHLGRVVRSRLLAVTAGQPDDKAAPAVDSWLLLSRHLIRLTDKIIGVDVLSPGCRNDPTALARIPLRSHLIEICLCEEARVGHQPLVDSAELIDAEFSVRDESSVFLG